MKAKYLLLYRNSLPLSLAYLTTARELLGYVQHVAESSMSGEDYAALELAEIPRQKVDIENPFYYSLQGTIYKGNNLMPLKEFIRPDIIFYKIVKRIPITVSLRVTAKASFGE